MQRSTSGTRRSAPEIWASASLIRRSLKPDLHKTFGDALTVKIGGTYNYEASSSNPNANLAGDFEVKYRITPDGRIQVKAFRESDFDAVASKNDVRTGLGLFYTKDFDSFSKNCLKADAGSRHQTDLLLPFKRPESRESNLVIFIAERVPAIFTCTFLKQCQVFTRQSNGIFFPVITTFDIETKQLVDKLWAKYILLAKVTQQFLNVSIRKSKPVIISQFNNAHHFQDLDAYSPPGFVAEQICLLLQDG